MGRQAALLWSGLGAFWAVAVPLSWALAFPAHLVQQLELCCLLQKRPACTPLCTRPLQPLDSSKIMLPSLRNCHAAFLFQIWPAWLVSEVPAHLSLAPVSICVAAMLCVWLSALICVAAIMRLALHVRFLIPGAGAPWAVDWPGGRHCSRK